MIIPELSVSDYRRSLSFYVEFIGFSAEYTRQEEGFAMLRMGEGHLMIDEIGLGRTFDDGHLPRSYPFGKGLNLQIKAAALDPILARLAAQKISLFLPPEEKWYRVHEMESGQRQFIVADPDGYLLRFYEDFGSRPLKGE